MLPHFAHCISPISELFCFTIEVYLLFFYDFQHNNGMSHIPKRHKRSHFTKQRHKLSTAQRSRLANRAARQLSHRFLSRQCQHIGMYLDNFGELPTLPLFLWAKKRGKMVYLPVVVGNALKFRKISYNHLKTNRVASHRLGMKEVKTGNMVSVEKLDLLFLPLVAADTQGNRMGMGGGFYDRTLAAVAKHATHKKVIKKPLRIGWCYDFQVVDIFATNPWDVPLHRIITPNKYHSCTS